MKLLNIYSIKGPNIYSYNPVIVMEVDLEAYREVHTDELPELTGALLEIFPGLQKHHCSKGYPGGFVERLATGTLLGHVMEHLALELQNMVGSSVKFGKTRFAEEINAYRLVFAYRNEQLGLAAGQKAYWCIETLLQRGKVDSAELVAELQEVLRKASYGTSTQALIDAAQKRGIPVLPLSTRSSLIQLGYGANQRRIQATTTDRTSCIAVDLACDKWETRQMLAGMGLPVARGYLATNEEEALAAMDNLARPVVVKPLDGNQGKGVTLNITTPDELKQAFELGKKYSPEILIEEFIQGNDYRLTVVNGQMVAASHRMPPYVTGDGRQTIRQLIDNVNAHAMRGDDHEKPLTKIKIDQVVLLNLAKQGLTPDSVLPQGIELFLRENGNLSTGGTACDVTEQVHPENRQLVERAIRVIGLDVAGVDLRMANIAEPISQNGGAIIEVNAAPGIRMHHYPANGKERNVADRIIEMLFQRGNGQIPIFAISGTNGKTTTTRLIQHVLMQTGQKVGMTTTDGIYINREMIYAGDTTGAWSAQLLLKDPAVEMAVLETARGGILKSGLGFQESDVGLVLNVSEDHLGLKGVHSLEDLANIKSLIAETVAPTGVCVLNADNPYTLNMAERVRGQVILFSLNQENQFIKNHVWAGGVAVVAANGAVKILKPGGSIHVLTIADIPMTYHGKALHQVENVLAAVAGLYGYGLGLDLIRSGLLSFYNDIESNPGRLNMVEGAGWKVILDYGHNIEGYRAIVQFAREVGCRRLLGVIGVPGDRQDESIVKVGKLAGDYFDRVWIKEDQDLRGRTPGEVAGLLRRGLVDGVRGTHFTIIYNEQEALKTMLSELREGDLGVIFYEKDPQRLLEIIKNYARAAEVEKVVPV